MEQLGYGDVDICDQRSRIPLGVRPILDVWMRDPHICIGRDGAYYLSGTTRSPRRLPNTAWVWNDGVRLWRSPDLTDWEELGLVWSLDDGPAWLSGFRVHDPDDPRCVPPDEFWQRPPAPGATVQRALWAPKVHYSPRLDNYFIVGCTNTNMGLPPERWIGGLFGGTFVLRSRSGEPRGPYELTTARPLTNCIDAKLFEDSADLYFIWQDGRIARISDTMDALSEVQWVWQTAFDPEPVKEGVHLFKHDRLYHLVTTIWSWQVEGRITYRHRGHGGPSAYSYDAVVASSPHIAGPYGPRYTSLIGGGHGNHFQDRDGNWWACVFIDPRDRAAERLGFSQRPALVPMAWRDGRIYPA